MQCLVSQSIAATGEDEPMTPQASIKLRIPVSILVNAIAVADMNADRKRSAVERE